MKRMLVPALVLLVAMPLLAQEPPKMTPEQQAAMDAWMKAMTPGDAHKALNDMVGTFNAKVSFWETPGGPPQVSEGVSESRWIMGGRFIETRFTGSMMGMPFEGLGYSGYDNVRKQYWSTWIDNSTTGLMLATGGAPTDGGKKWTYKGGWADPMTGKEISVTETVVVKDADHHTFEMWGPDKSGKTFKMMQIEYTRKK